MKLSKHIMLFISSFLITFMSLKFIGPLLRYKLLDLPNYRSSHKNPTPTGGGISFVITGILGSLAMGNATSLLFLPLSLIGFYDDRFMNIFRIYIY